MRYLALALTPLIVVLGLLAVLVAGCENAAKQRAYKMRDQVMPGAPCVHQKAGEHGEGNTFCTDGTTLIICVDNSPCITVHAAAEIGPQ